MNELVNAPISPWYAIPAAVGLLALAFAFVPGVLLHLGVLIYPKGHTRRQEFTAELYTVPFVQRPFWVAGTLVRCLFEGTSARLQSRRPHPALIVKLFPDEDLQGFIHRYEQLLGITPGRRYRFHSYIADMFRQELRRRDRIRHKGN